MKTNYYSQKIVNGNDTIYIGEPSINLTVSSGTHKFYACSGNITITSASVKIYLQQCPSMQITNTVGAKTYRGNYGIGDIFMSTNAESPSIYFGGSWEQITADAYLKIVTNGAGGIGGTNSHIHNSGNIGAKITTTGDGLDILEGRIGNGWYANYRCTGSITSVSASHTALVPTEGDTGVATINPYYYGVYVWRRANFLNPNTNKCEE